MGREVEKEREVENGVGSVECGVPARALPNQICRKQMSGRLCYKCHSPRKPMKDTKRRREKAEGREEKGNQTKHPLSVALKCSECTHALKIPPNLSKDHNDGCVSCAH